MIPRRWETLYMAEERRKLIPHQFSLLLELLELSKQRQLKLNEDANQQQIKQKVLRNGNMLWRTVLKKF